ncbi:MAG: hypothetical protein K6F84_07750 [Lachnospiraceae bacterium]|nr:hypothetical protein [Lachnospiraceae bacterium]
MIPFYGILLFIAVTLMGAGSLFVLDLFKKDKTSLFLWCPVGLVTLILWGGFFNIAGVFLNVSFDLCQKGMAVAVILMCVPGIFGVASKIRNLVSDGDNTLARNLQDVIDIGSDKEAFSKKILGILAVISLIILGIQIYMVSCGRFLYTDGDMTAEFSNSIVKYKSFYNINPLRGVEFTEGMPVRIKALCLPALYALLSVLLKINVTKFVWAVIPIVVITAVYMVSFSLADCVLKNKVKALACVILVEILVFVGNYGYTQRGFLLMGSAFRGTVIRDCVLVPLFIYCFMKKRYLLCVMCAVAEAVTVWTLYGAGLIIPAWVILGVISLMSRKALGEKKKDGEI